MKQLLIVYHSQSGNTALLAEAVLEGARRVAPVASRLLRAGEAGAGDLLGADAVLFGTPENFGYMSGALKDFFDRTYESCREQTEGLAYAVFISAGNDGSGAEYHIDRIARGYSMKRIAEALIVQGEVTEQALRQAEELGHTLAAALEMGIV